MILDNDNPMPSVFLSQMHSRLSTYWRRNEKRRNRVGLLQFGAWLKRPLACAFLLAVHAAWGMAHAAECDSVPTARIPAIQNFPINIDDIKKALTNYRFSFYDDDLAAAADSARKYVE